MPKSKKQKLIRIDEVRNVLGARPAEIERWVATGDVPIAEMRSIHKYGKVLSVRMFDPETVAAAIPLIDEWRVRDLNLKRAERKQRADATADQRRISTKINAELRSLCGLRDYPAFFPLARGLKRKLIFFCGPTNSGKTHCSMTLVTEANAAEVLSPLRLLALEHYDTLIDAGCNASMVTGEEILGDVLATHYSRTVECADFSRVVDVALIDEIQMLDDPSRGWAWTAAAFGVPARTVVMTGSPEALPLVKKVAELTGEDLQIVRLERLSELKVMEYSLSLREIQKGDAVIVFSKNDIHQVRTILADIGKVTTAAVYGGLDPEVRRAEAARFASGEADVLVATDAIGMGLNLPINRVLFTSTLKFDGTKLRPLTIGEINQIAGRAGRFGKAELGYTGTVEMPRRTAVRHDIRRAIGVFQPSLRDKFLFRPNGDLVTQAGKLLNTRSLETTLDYLQANLARGNKRFELAELDNAVVLARGLDVHPNLSMSDKFTFSCAPCDIRDPAQQWALQRIADAYATHGIVHAPPLTKDGQLHALETASKVLSMYLWLARKFPKAFVDVEDVLTERIRLQVLICIAIAEKGQKKKMDAETRKELVFEHLNPGRHYHGFDGDDIDFDDDDFDYRIHKESAPPKSRHKRRNRKKNAQVAG